MAADLLTVLWKEWKDLFGRFGESRRVLFELVGVPCWFGVFWPLLVGREWVSSPLQQLVVAWVPMFLSAQLVADSFAGERERRTLEALLATRLSDRAILFGKLAAVTAYGLGLGLLALAAGLVTVNVAHGRRGLLLPGGAAALIWVIGFLQVLLVASLGVFVSLRAATVQQARQWLSYGLMGVCFGLPVGVGLLPMAARNAVVAALSKGEGLLGVELVTIAALAVVDALLIVAVMARFHRARLILD